MRFPRTLAALLLVLQFLGAASDAAGEKPSPASDGLWEGEGENILYPSTPLNPFFDEPDVSRVVANLTGTVASLAVHVPVLHNASSQLERDAGKVQAQVERMRKRRQAAVEIQRRARGFVERAGRSAEKLRALERDRRLSAKAAERARKDLAEALERDRAAAAAAANNARDFLDDLARRRREAEEARRRRAKLEHDAATRLQVWALECRANRYMLPYRKHRGGHYRGCPCCVNKPGKYSRVFGRYSARASTPPGAAPPARREKPRPRPEPRDFEAVAMEFGYRGPPRRDDDRGPPRGYETDRRRPHPSEQHWQFDPRRPRLNRSDSYDRTTREYEELQERVENLRRAQHELMVADMRRVPLYDQPARDPGLLTVARAEIDGTLGHVLGDASPPRSGAPYASRRPRQQLTRRQLGYE